MAGEAETPLQKMQRLYSDEAIAANAGVIARNQGAPRVNPQDELTEAAKKVPVRKPKPAPAAPQGTTPPARIQPATALRERKTALDIVKEELERQRTINRINNGGQ